MIRSKHIVVETIQRLLELGQPASIGKISSISGKKKMDVLREITNNKSLLKLNKKGDIIGFYDVYNKQLNEMFEKGLLYSIDKINYNSDSAIDWKDPRAESMKEEYWEGGFGDCVRCRYVLNRDYNIKKLEEFGIRNIDSVKKEELKPFDDFWKPV